MTATMSNQNFETNLKKWLSRVSKISAYELSVDPKGLKYAKIIYTTPQTSVFCFVNKSNGDVLKAAGWNAPAKTARGNIYQIGNEGVGKFGADYLR